MKGLSNETTHELPSAQDRRAHQLTIRLSMAALNLMVAAAAWRLRKRFTELPNG